MKPNLFVVRFLAAAALGLPALACTSRDASAQHDIRATPARPSPLVAAIRLLPSGRPPVDLRVELALTPDQHARGLMFRKHLAGDEGMLFLFAQEREQAFYMRNTYIPLDILFFNAAHELVGVLADMQPLDETPRSVGAPSRYVLEVNARSAARWGLQPGDQIDLKGLPGNE